jgi:hypothetical protein
MHLSRHPLCTMCIERGRTTPATVVDHVEPHHGDPDLLYDPANLQSLCAPCHDGAKQREEVTGRVSGCGTDGVPLDGAHHWNAETRQKLPGARTTPRGEGGSNLQQVGQDGTGETCSRAPARFETRQFLPGRA